MEQFYSAQGLARWEKQARRMLLAALLTAGIALAACIVLCCHVNTANASLLLAIVIGMSALGGWAVILLLAFGYFPARAEIGHIRGIREDQAAEYAGVLRLSTPQWRIPHSVAFVKAALEMDGEEKSFNVNVRLIPLMPADGTRVRVRAVRKFITACEVQHEET